MFQKRLAAIALVCLLSGCACNEALGLAGSYYSAGNEGSAPAALTTLPVPPEPLEPGYSRTH